MLTGSDLKVHFDLSNPFMTLRRTLNSPSSTRGRRQGAEVGTWAHAADYISPLDKAQMLQGPTIIELLEREVHLLRDVATMQPEAAQHILLARRCDPGMSSTPGPSRNRAAAFDLQRKHHSIPGPRPQSLGSLLARTRCQAPPIPKFRVRNLACVICAQGRRCSSLVERSRPHRPPHSLTLPPKKNCFVFCLNVPSGAEFCLGCIPSTPPTPPPPCPGT